MRMKFKNLSVVLFAAAVALMAGCGQKSDQKELGPGDFLYDNAHIFAHTYVDDVFVQVHLCGLYEWGEEGFGGPREMEVIRGNEREHYYLRLKKISRREEQYYLYEDVVYNLFLEENATESVGTVAISCIPSECMLKRVELKIRKAASVELENVFAVNNGELVDSYTPSPDAPNNNVRLFECLRGELQPYDDWAQSDKLLMLFLFENEDPTKVDFSPMESWTITDSPDRAIRSFCSSYYSGGNGHGSVWEMNILYYRSGGVNHVVRDFDHWILELEDCDGNFPYLSDSKIWTWGKGEDTIYFFEDHYNDEVPQPFLENERFFRNEMAFLGAFRIVNGSLIPANVLKTKNDVLSKVLVCSDGPAADYKLDRKKGLLGVPLVEKDDYAFHGRYLIYEWNPQSGMFEYDGRKEKM